MLQASRIRVFLALMIAFAFAAAVTVSGGPSIAQEGDAEATPQAMDLPAIPPEAETLEGNWPMAQGDYAATRNAAGTEISSDNIDQLEVDWTFEFTATGFFGAFTAAPVVIDDVIYLQDMQSNIFALDRESGDVIWEAEYNIGTIGPNGVAVGYGHVYAGLGDAGEVVAVDAETGEEVWRERIGSPPGEGIDMSPTVYDGLVYISTVPGTGLGSFYEGGNRGVLYALDALTGERVWWWDTTGDENAWNAARVAGGGGLWQPPSVDTDTGNIFFGVGNPSPWPLTPECPNAECRPGDNLYTNSMVSMNTEVGGVRWYYQDAPHDLFDHDFQNTPVLIDAEIDGVETILVVGSGKTGNVVAVNDSNGQLLWRTPVGTHMNADLTELPEDEYVEIWPGFLGGVETAIAYANGLVIATYVELPQFQSAIGQSPDQYGYNEATGGIVAIDVTNGEIVWETEIPTMPLAGATIANDLVFSSGLNGIIQAFDINTGEEVWSYQLSAGVNAPIAIAGDMLFIGAGTFQFPSVEERIEPGADPAAPMEEEGDPVTAEEVEAPGGVTEDATPIAPEAAEETEANGEEQQELTLQFYAFRIATEEPEATPPVTEATPVDLEATPEMTDVTGVDATPEVDAPPAIADATPEPVEPVDPMAAAAEATPEDATPEPDATPEVLAPSPAPIEAEPEDVMIGDATPDVDATPDPDATPETLAPSPAAVDAEPEDVMVGDATPVDATPVADTPEIEVADATPPADATPVGEELIEAQVEAIEDATPPADATPVDEELLEAAIEAIEDATPIAATPIVDATPVAEEEEALLIDMVDIAFVPDEFTIEADTDVVIDFINTGVAVHDFTIDELDIKIVLNPGEEGELTINAPAGTYEFYCSVPGHRQAGMVGTMTVE
jgi:outer membrane protein assembly factor BamB/plastocyanin